ncbi:MAG: carbohydrate ABC transporter permease [Clostridiaceae bacterium]
MKQKLGISNTIIAIVLGVITLFSLFPFYIMLVMGTYYSEDIFKGIPLLPHNDVFDNFKTVFASGFLRFYWNSIYTSLLATILAVFFSTMAGFAFSKYSFKGKKVLFNFILATMMIPNGLGLIAFVIEMRYFHWTNSHLPLFMPWIANSFGVFLMTQYMKEGIPAEVLESARIDGCSEFRLFLQFAFAFVKPAVVTLGLLTFLGAWNNFLVPLIILNKQSLFTVPLGIFSLNNLFRVDYGARILALSIATVPLIIIFVINSKSFIRGLATGAVKG